MEQEKANQNDAQASDTKSIYQGGLDELTEYRVFEHPLLPKRIVKQGVCWPAIFVGPAYLIYRRLWVPLIVWVVAIGLVRYLAFTHFQICTISGNDCSIEPDDVTTVAQISEVAIFIGLVLLGFVSNSIWEKDLMKRGYIMTKSVRARSMDDALAIIEREKMPAHT